MSNPRLIVTGSSGFVGRHLLEAVKDDYHIFAMARRSQKMCGAVEHPNITWYQVDIAERDNLERIFEKIRSAGGADILIHLAAYYDFSLERNPEYYRVNVAGFRNVLDCCKAVGVRKVIFSSSLAACSFPSPGGILNEESSPDGDNIYAETKGIGEAMLGEYEESLRAYIIRFAAIYSDWCEYFPLFHFLNTWLTNGWKRRVLGGRGRSAIPYLHIRDAVFFLQSLLARINDLSPGAVFIASPDGAVSHRELFESATSLYHGLRKKPLLLPKILCRIGLLFQDHLGRLLGDRSFERPWMGRYIDKSMTVDASRTRAVLEWEARSRLKILRRMPFLIENYKTDPITWFSRNRAAMKRVTLHNNLTIHRVLELHEREIREMHMERIYGPAGKERFAHYRMLRNEELQWDERLLLRQLMNAVRTRDKMVFMNHCRDLSSRLFHAGFNVEEIANALEAMEQACLSVLREDQDSRDLTEDQRDLITMTIQLGIDQVHDVFEQFSLARHKIFPTSP